MKEPNIDIFELPFITGAKHGGVLGVVRSRDVRANSLRAFGTHSRRWRHHAGAQARQIRYDQYMEMTHMNLGI